MKYLFLMHGSGEPLPEPGTAKFECADLDEALRWAATLPSATEGCIEIRPVIQVAAPG